ncbi:MAG: DMT family transporter [Synechococcales bacterium]|nr:DMT family transporter [Synechococcales bacterium]
MSLIYLKLVLTMAFWGGTFIAGRILAQEMSPYGAALGRFAIAAIALYLWTYHRQEPLPPLKARQIFPILVLGLSGVFAYNVFFFSGLQTIPASRAGLIIALNPVVITLCSALFLQERLTRFKLIGTLISLVGAALVITDGQLATLLSEGIGRGELLLLGCVASWSVYSIVGRQVMKELSPVVATTYAVWVGAIALLPLALWDRSGDGSPLTMPSVWLSLLYLGLLGTVLGFSWYYEGIQAIGPAKASIFINLVPIFAVTFGALFLQESITSALLLGSVLVILGVSCVNWNLNRLQGTAS